MKKLSGILQDKPYLAWYIKDRKNLSQESIVEHILNFGDWEDYRKVEDTLGITKTSKIFEQLTKKKRVNLRKKTVSYFTQYFHKYA